MLVPALRRRALRCVAVAVLALAAGTVCGAGLGVGGVADLDGSPSEAAPVRVERLAGGTVGGAAGGAEAIGVQILRAPAVERAVPRGWPGLFAVAVLAAGVACLVGRAWVQPVPGGCLGRRSVLGAGSVGRRAPPVALAA